MCSRLKPTVYAKVQTHVQTNILTSVFENAVSIQTHLHLRVLAHEATAPDHERHVFIARTRVPAVPAAALRNGLAACAAAEFAGLLRVAAAARAFVDAANAPVAAEVRLAAAAARCFAAKLARIRCDGRARLLRNGLSRLADAHDAPEAHFARDLVVRWKRESVIDTAALGDFLAADRGALACAFRLLDAATLCGVRVAADAVGELGKRRRAIER